MTFLSSARLLTLLAVVMLAVSLGATPLYGQRNGTAFPDHVGFWLDLGIGPGYGLLECTRCGELAPDDPWNGGLGVSGYGALGMTVHPNLLLGGEINLWVRRSMTERRDATLISLVPVLQVYPVARSGLYLKGGAGLGLSILAGGNGLAEGSGLAVQAGAGYDVRLRPRISLAPYATFVQHLAKGAAGQNKGEPVTGPSNPGSVAFGIAVRWH